MDTEGTSRAGVQRSLDLKAPGTAGRKEEEMRAEAADPGGETASPRLHQGAQAAARAGAAARGGNAKSQCRFHLAGGQTGPRTGPLQLYRARLRQTRAPVHCLLEPAALRRRLPRSRCGSPLRPRSGRKTCGAGASPFSPPPECVPLGVGHHDPVRPELKGPSFTTTIPIFTRLQRDPFYPVGKARVHLEERVPRNSESFRPPPFHQGRQCSERAGESTSAFTQLLHGEEGRFARGQRASPGREC